ncbi:MAG: NAD(P)/FAD-dependent oxidoreductase [Rhodothermales bacterium]
MSTVTTYPRIVIVGAGFAGLTLARELKDSDAEVWVIDRNNYHTFQPLMYQVATAGLEPEEIAYAVRGVFHRQENCEFRLGSVSGVDFEAKQVHLENGTFIGYDYLVLAVGASTTYFGVPGAEAHSFPLKSLADAINLRSHIIRKFEQASYRPDLIADGILNFVIVGAGPTGVEMAGALAELFDLVLRKDYPNLPIDDARVTVIDSNDLPLKHYAEGLRDYTRRTLERRGVEFMFGRRVTEVTEDEVFFNDGTSLPAYTLVWAAGVTVNPLAHALGLEQTRGGRIVVDESLRVPAHQDVFVLGDLAGATDGDGNLYPQLASVAQQQGKHLAQQLGRLLDTKPAEPFHYLDKGTMATIGRNAAVAELRGGLKAKGFIAWLMWLALHLFMLIGFRNRLNVLINWGWNYLTYDRSARLILDVDDLEDKDSRLPDEDFREEAVAV